MDAYRPPIPTRYAQFRNFMRDVFVEFYNWQEPTWVQNEIADQIQYGTDREIIMAYRGCGKSSILQCYAVWCLMLDPQKSILIASETTGLAKIFVAQMKRIIKDYRPCQWLYPDDDQINEASRFYVKPCTKSATISVKATSIGSSITGLRADLIIADDVETARNALTLESRSKIGLSFEEFSSILRTRGRIAVLGTPHSHDSTYLVLEKKGYTCKIYPAEVPDPVRLKRYGDRISETYLKMLDAGIEPSTPADPERLDSFDLTKKKIEFRPAGYSLQFLLDTSLSDELKYPLKLKDLIVMDLDINTAPGKMSWTNSPEYKIKDIEAIGFGFDAYYRPMLVNESSITDYDSSILYVDPSGRGADETAVAVVRAAAGRLFIPKVKGMLGGYTRANLEAISHLARQYKVNKVIIESNFGDGMFNELLKPVLNSIYPCMIEDVKVSQRKELRILDTLEPIMQQHRLIISREVILEDLADIATYGQTMDAPQHYSLFHQMTRLTKERGCLSHDDRLDALAGAVAYLTKFMSIDPDIDISRRSKALELLELEQDRAYMSKLMRRADDFNIPNPNWLGDDD